MKKKANKQTNKTKTKQKQKQKNKKQKKKKKTSTTTTTTGSSRSSKRSRRSRTSAVEEDETLYLPSYSNPGLNHSFRFKVCNLFSFVCLFVCFFFALGFLEDCCSLFCCVLLLHLVVLSCDWMVMVNKEAFAAKKPPPKPNK